MKVIDQVTMLAFSALLGVAAPALADDDSPPLLNSERIEQRFGSYGIELLAQTDAVRIASLYSLENGEKVTRTFAVTRYSDSVDARLAQAHERILAGGSIGATLAEAGWTVTRRHLWVGDVPATTGIGSLMNIDDSSPLGLHVFDLEVSRGDEQLHYATIAEVHHPDHLDRNGIEQLFGPTESASGTRAATMLGLTLDAMLELTSSVRESTNSG